MVVYTGLLKLLDDETQLANVLSHEAAHVVARHAVRQEGGGGGGVWGRRQRACILAACSQQAHCRQPATYPAGADWNANSVHG